MRPARPRRKRPASDRRVSRAHAQEPPLPDKSLPTLGSITTDNTSAALHELHETVVKGMLDESAYYKVETGVLLRPFQVAFEQRQLALRQRPVVDQW